MRTKSSTDLGTLFFGAYRRQVLALLLLHPDESFHLRELARITNTQPGTLRRELTQLVEAGVLSREKLGNLVRYKANRESPIFDELSGIFRKITTPPDHSTSTAGMLRAAESAAQTYSSTARNKSRGSRALQRLHVSRRTLAALGCKHHLKRLSLFGSVMREDFGPDSDVDVLVEFRPDKPLSLFEVVDLRDELSKLFKGRKVDVVTPAALGNPYRRKAIESDLEQVYASG